MSGRLARRLWLAALVVGSYCQNARAQDKPEPPAEEASAQESRERAIMERFLALLEKNPRKGTALDRVYGYHIERGSLDALVAKYEERVSRKADDGAAWLILGLVESQRGRDASAVAALRQAEQARPDDPLPSYYLGQSLVLVGQPDEAAQAFERAIERKPGRNDLLEIFQALGRVHQRAQRNEQALEVWNRLEALFPDDARVQEQIAQALVEESQFALALPRLERLAGKVTDDYRKIQLKIDAADLKLRLGKPKEALADFEGLLAKLNPESWLYRDVRRRVEDVFLRSDDQAGLAAYYESWLEKNAEDVDAMARLGRTLALQGRAREAQKWFDQAVKLAPGKRELRLALVEQLVIDKRFAAAAAQYEAMAKNDPANPDTLREWGRMILRDRQRPEAERKAAAADIWRKMLAAKPNDAATAVLVADLMRKAEMADDAIALYQKAIALAPAAPQYREYLGEYYHTLKRSKEALATWAEMAAGANRNAQNLGRLAEVEAGFGYKSEAIADAAAACELAPDSFDAQLQYADLLKDQNRLEEALKPLSAAERAAADREEREAVLDRLIACETALGKLPERIDALKKETSARGAEARTAGEAWRKLSRYLEAAGREADAHAAIERALAADARSVPSWTAAARLYEAAGNLSDAVKALRTLADLDRRARSEYLTKVARLEARLGRGDEAIKAGRDLLAAAPGKLESYQFFAELCFQLGKTDDGLDALRRAVRLNEGDAKALLALADTLAQQFRAEESIEMYWRAFDKATEIDAKTGIVSRLTALYLQRNQFDRLIARLERQGREDEHQRDAAICLAQAYASAGDYASARQELERLLAANTRDTQLMRQLSTLAENEGDLQSATKYARQMLEIAPNDEGFSRLAQLYVRSGEIGEAEQVWTRMASGEPAPAQVLLALDSLTSHGKYETVLEITARRLRARPGDWEALYREGYALFKEEKLADAAERFRAILALNLPDDTLGDVEKARRRASSSHQPGAAPAASSASILQSIINTHPVMARVQQVSRLRLMSGLEARPGYSVSSLTFAPADYGQARLGALAMLAAVSAQAGPAPAHTGDKAGSADGLEAQLSAAAERRPADLRALWDLFYLRLLQTDAPRAYDAARALAKAAPADLAAQWAFLMSVPTRAAAPVRGTRIVSEADQSEGAPLPPEDLDLLVASYKTINAQKPEWSSALAMTTVAGELKRGGRAQAEQAFYEQAVASAHDADSLLNAIRLAAERGDVENLLRLFDSYERLKGTQGNTLRGGYIPAGVYYMPATGVADSLARAMLVRADAKAHGDITRILDRYLAALGLPEQAAQRSRVRLAGSNAATLRIQIWMGKLRQTVSIDFPSPNAYLDAGAIQLLRQAFALYQRDDLASDLVAHFNRRLQNGSDNERVYAHLALCALDWWADDKDEAVRQLSLAAEAAKGDPELLLSLAELRMQRNEPEEALAVADSFEPLDQRAMQRRELLALRLAVVTGDVDRARRAAERLFGLRLEADTQTQLATQMHQLGMHEMAEAILGRARRRAGNNTTALVGLMAEYQRQNNMDVAVQIAHQILSHGQARQLLPSGAYTSADVAEQEAILVLARSGKLKELTERLEAQLARTPGSTQLQQLLADYYQAAGDKAKVKATYEQMIKARPEDARLRMQVAQQVARSGDTAAALAHYKAALKQEPALLELQFDDVMRVFQQERKLDELVDFIESLDLRATRQSSRMLLLIDMLLQDKAKRERGLALFRKALKELPDQREVLLMRLSENDSAQVPELYDYLEQAVLPSPAQTRVAPWFGIETVNMLRGNGLVGGPSTLLLQTATREGKLDALATKLEAARTRLPSWRGGQALLALVEARRGRVDAARTLLEPLVDDPKAPLPAYTCALVGQEIDEIAALAPLAQRIYEANDRTDASMSFDFRSNPAQRAVQVYMRAGRPQEARRQLLRFVGRAQERYGYDPGYAAYRDMIDRLAIGRKLVEIGFPADAVRLYGEVLANSEMMEAAKRYSAASELQVAQLQQALTQAMASLRDDTLAATLRTLVRDGEGEGDAAGRGVDLVLLVQPRALDQARVTSVLERALDDAKGSAELREEVDARLARLLEREPENLQAHVARALVALAGDQQEEIHAAIERLVRAVEQAPLDALPPDSRANARQRKEAAASLGLWLVARACRAHESLRAQADALSRRALEAARRQSDPIWALAMLREAGQSALDRGDRAEAEARWSEMLKLLLAAKAPAPPAQAPPRSAPAAPPASPRPAPAAPSTPARGARPAAVNKNEAPARAQRAPGPARGSAAPIITLERFEQIGQVARLAAQNGFDKLALEAVGEALRGGPPIVPIAMPTRAVSAARVSLSPANNPANATTEATVAALLAELDAHLARHEAEPKAVYEALRDLVLPAARPAEIFLYPGSLSTSQSLRPASGGAILARWAVRAEAGDDLRQRIAARQKEATAALPAQVLLAILAQQTSNDAPLQHALEGLATRLETETLQTSAELACHAALPVLDKPKAGEQTEAAAVALLERASKNLSGANNDALAGKLLVVLARHQFRAGRVAAGRKALEAYAALLDRAPVTNARQALLGADPGLQRRSQQLQLAAEYARAGLLAEGFDLLGQYVDYLMSARANPNLTADSEPLPDVFASLARQLAAQPAAARYALLRDWTLPAAGRPGMRILAGFVDEPVPPPVFGRALPPEADRGLLSSPALLISAARAAGQLDALAALVQDAAEKKVEDAEALALLIQIARGQPEAAEPRLKALLKAWRAVDPGVASVYGMRFATNAERPRNRWPDYLLVRACLGEPRLADLGASLARAFPPTSAADEYPFRLQLDLQASEALRALGWPRPTADNAVLASGLLPWAKAGWSMGEWANPASGFLRTSTSLAAAWGAGEGHISRAGKPGTELVVFQYPLTGRFEISAEMYISPTAGSALGYGGWMLAPSTNASTRFYDPGGTRQTPATRVVAIGRNESISRRASLATRNDYTRVAIAVEPGKVRYSVGGVVCFEDTEPSANVPWLVLAAWGLDRSDVRNIQLKGTPEIPREVALVSSDQLAGWSTNFYGEALPAQSKETEPATVSTPRLISSGGLYTVSSLPRTAAPEPPQPDWRAHRGVIEGRRLSDGTSAANAPSLLAYCRPFFAGESVRYDFYYEPNRIEAHPALGQVAFLLAPGGLRLRWLARNVNGDWTGLPLDNAVEPPGASARPTLHPGAWNQAKLTFSADAVRATLEINGTQVLEYPLEPTNDRTFGFYHDKALTSARIRNVVLTGPWPQRVAEGALLVASGADLEKSREEAPSPRAAHALVGEENFLRDARLVLKHAQSLPAAERYAFLSGWVLPSAEHATFRLAGDFTPVDPPPGDAFRADAAREPAPAEHHTGGQVVAPALLLVAEARAAGKLDDLAARVQSTKADSARDARGRLALLALVHQAQGRLDEAARDLADLKPLLEQLEPDAPNWERWPEFVAATSALEAPALCKAALVLAQGLDKPLSGKEPSATNEVWPRHVRHLLGLALERTRVGDAARASNETAKLAAWASVTQTQAASRGSGAPLPRWVLREGTLLHYPGHLHDFMYLRTPIRGEFELTGELVGGAGAPALVYGGLAIGLDDKREQCEVSMLGRSPRTFPIRLPLAQSDDPVKFRFVVQTSMSTLYLNDRKIHEAGLPANPGPDPWLAIYQPAGRIGGVRKLKLSGMPLVPERVELSRLPDLTGWLTDELVEPPAGEDPRWAKRGDVIVGRLERESAGPHEESLLRYHRPLLEDGRVEYEFFYEPGRALVHPALDRLVLLLDPAGVRVHWLTDGPFERTGLDPGNATRQPEHERGEAKLPLEPRAWNRARLAIQGDTLKLSLNDKLIYERKLEPGNDRGFGLFHYAGDTEAQVRNVILQGAWGQSVPAGLGFD